MADDITKLSEAEEAQHRDHIYQVVFVAFIEEPDQTGDAPDWEQDEFTVAAGPDAQQAVDRVREYVLNPDQYGIKASKFRLLGVKVLAVAEI